MIAIKAFEPERLILWWTHHRIECAVYWNSMTGNYNGYCRIPADSPDLILAAAFLQFENSPEEVARRVESLSGAPWAAPGDAERIAKWVRNNGYDALPDYDVHGGLTYGPDEQGWVGFDCGHAWDDIDDDEISEVVGTSWPEGYAKYQETCEHMKEIGVTWPPGRMRLGDKLDRMTRIWRLPDVVAEVNSLAVQVVAYHALVMERSSG